MQSAVTSTLDLTYFPIAFSLSDPSGQYWALFSHCVSILVEIYQYITRDLSIVSYFLY
jgi:hypothetical protein